jgi:ABC-2 type transport system ATP-binding protein
MAAGLLPPSSGRIAIAAAPLRPFSQLDAVAYLPQLSCFPGLLTTGEVLEFTAIARGSDAHARGEILEVTGIDAVLDRPIRELSGGWVRRLGLAVSLLPPADLLLLDEPFVGLDPDTLDRLVAHLDRRVAQGATLLLASHEFEVVDDLADRVAVLDDGRLRGVFPARSGHSRSLYRQILAEPSASRADERRHVG